MGNVLVTGGAGYIGSVISHMLIDLVEKLVIVDDLRDGNGNEEAVPKNSFFFKASYGDKQVLETILKDYKIGFVIHMAASANVPDSVVNPLEYYENNVSNTVNLLDLMNKHNVKKIIFSSTAAVYGTPQYEPVDENHPLKPINPYGHSKLMDEQIIKDAANAYGLQYNMFRYFCAAGATEHNGESREIETHIIPLLIDTVLGRQKTFSVFGNDFPTRDGMGVRDYIHVADIANAHILSMKYIEKHPNEIFNLGTENGYSVMEVLGATENVLGVKIPYEITDRRPGDPATIVASSEKAKKLLGWSPELNLEKTILSAYKWRKNPRY